MPLDERCCRHDAAFATARINQGSAQATITIFRTTSVQWIATLQFIKLCVISIPAHCRGGALFAHVCCEHSVTKVRTLRKHHRKGRIRRWQQTLASTSSYSAPKKAASQSKNSLSLRASKMRFAT